MQLSFATSYGTEKTGAFPSSPRHSVNSQNAEYDAPHSELSESVSDAEAELLVVELSRETGDADSISCDDAQ